MFEKMLEQVYHMGFIVKDIDETMKNLVNLLGIKPWSLWTLKPPFLRDTTLHGKKVSHGFRFAIATIGNVSIELISPLEGESVYVEHLKERGEGFHHIALGVPTEEQLEQVVEELKGQGGEVIQSGRLGDIALYYYVDVKNAGLVLEIFTGHTPPPEKTYP
jgi:catechol 2,3-dioxygenase-like lactoylglutathione lyase family enzyme